MTNPFFDELSKFSKSKLKPTETKISYINGRTYVRSSQNGLENEIQIDSEQDVGKESSIIYWSRSLGYLVDLVPDLSIDEILPRLFLSGDDVASNVDILRSKKITHILNLTTNVANVFDGVIKYKKIMIYDLCSVDIGQYLDEAVDFIDQALSSDDNSVLVHCNAGVSRSSAFVIAFLMKKRICPTFQAAYEFVKTKRSKICPNDGFRQQLIDLEKRLSNKD